MRTPNPRSTVLRQRQRERARDTVPQTCDTLPVDTAVRQGSTAASLLRAVGATRPNTLTASRSGDRGRPIAGASSRCFPVAAILRESCKRFARSRESATNTEQSREATGRVYLGVRQPPLVDLARAPASACAECCSLQSLARRERSLSVDFRTGSDSESLRIQRGNPLVICAA